MAYERELSVSILHLLIASSVCALSWGNQGEWLAKTTTAAAEKGTWKDIQEMDGWRLER